MTEPKFGSPQTELPPPNARGVGRVFWRKVVDYLKTSPDVWHPLVGSPFQGTTLRNIASLKNSPERQKEYGRMLPLPLQDEHIELQMRSGVFYAKWTTK